MQSVSYEKYLLAKQAACEWHRQLTELQKKYSSQGEKLDFLRHDQAGLENELAEAFETNRSLQEEMEKIRSENLTGMDVKVISLQNQIDQANSALATLQKSYTEVLSECEKLREENKRLRADIPGSDLADELQDLQERIGIHEKTEKDLMKQLKEKESRYRQKMSEKERECKDVVSKLEYQNRISNLENQIKSLHERK